MTEQEFQELFDALRRIQGINVNQAGLVATWTLAARGFVAEVVDCLPHIAFVGLPKVARDRAVSLVAESVSDLLVDATRVRKRRGIVLIEDYDELQGTSEEGAEIARELLLRPEAPMDRPVLMGCGQWPFPDSTPALVVKL
jgi:hypothetical protein